MLKKTLVLASTALGLVLSAQAYAQDSIDDNNVAVFDSVAADEAGAVANDNSVALNKSENDGALANDQSVAVNDSFKIQDSFQVNDSMNETFTADDSFNTWTSLDVNVAVASSVLTGTIASVEVPILAVPIEIAENTIEGHAFANASGITAVSQSAGSNNLTQQSVVVQSHMNLGSAYK
jgi:hypothetical protein